MADWQDIQLESATDAMDDDFEPLDFCDTDDDSEAEDGWVVFGSSPPAAANASLQANAQALSAQLKDDNYFTNRCPGKTLSDLEGTAIYCKPKTTARPVECAGPLESQRAKMLRLIMERSFNACKRPPQKKKEQYTKGRYFVGGGPGQMLNKGYKEQALTPTPQPASKLPKGRNYYVNSGPGTQSVGKIKGSYTVGACPGIELRKRPQPADDASSAYRQAYRVFTPSAAKINALEKGLLRAMELNSDPRAKKLAKHLERNRVAKQLERARHARARALCMTEKSTKTAAEERNCQLREAFTTAIPGAKYAIPGAKPKPTAMSPVKIPPSVFFEDVVEEEGTTKRPSRDELVRMAFADGAKVQAAQKVVRELGVGGRKGSGQGIAIEHEQSMPTRDDLLRQAFQGGTKFEAQRQAARTATAVPSVNTGPRMSSRRKRALLKRQKKKDKGKKAKLDLAGKGKMLISARDADALFREGYAGRFAGRDSAPANRNLYPM